MKLTFARISLAALLAGIGSFVQAQAPEVISVLEEAGNSAPDMINLLHQREWVRLDESGKISGKLSILTAKGEAEGRVGAKIVVSRDGKAILETMSDVDGSFVLEGLKPGAYAIQSRGDYTFAAYALHVLPADAKHLSTDLEMYASVISAQKATELINTLMVPADLEASEDVYYREFSTDPLAEKREFNKSHKVALRDGALVGRVSRPGWTYSEQDLTGTMAQIVREGEVIAKTPVSKDGYYRVENLEPGVYDLFVSGDDGFAVLAFEAVQPSEPLAAKAAGAHLVSTQVGMASDCLCCEMIYQPEVTACNSCEIAQAPVINECDTCAAGLVDAAPVMGGGFAGPGGFGGGFGGGAGGGFGGGAGGGGFGGGAGGLGGLLGVAGLAVGITALSNDDGFNANQASLIAP